MLKVSDRVAVTFSGKTSKLLEFIAMAEEEGFEPPGPLRAQRFSRRVIALWLAGKLLKTKDAVRLALDGLGPNGSLL